ncbi:MAG: Twin-arginine translocation pathway signal sequence domain-containing protein, partial [Pseudomonadota bacterium]
MTRRTVLNRRRFLTALGASAAALPLVSLPGFVRAAGKTPGQGSGAGNILVLIELAGGNDGLNTVIPTRDPAYRGLRPTIGLLRSETLTLDRDTGLHPAMGAVADIWDRGDLRIVEGVGYPNPNRSHFRSIEIWNAGQGADSSERTG